MKTLAKTLLAAVMGCSMMAISFGADEENLLKNGSFQPDDKGRPAFWELGGPEEFSIVTDNLPAGSERAIKTTVKGPRENYGSILQDVKGLKPNTAYVLEGKVKASVAKTAFFMLKIYNTGKESRLESKYNEGTEWEPINLEFTTGDATNISVLCRFLREAPENTVLFADIKLGEKK
jgi:hypothetical protein